MHWLGFDQFVDAEIMLIHHTDCGMLTFSDDDFRRQVQQETGIKPEWPCEAFDDLEEDVRQSDRADQGKPGRLREVA
jgi:carbonic anhydrase